MNISLIGIRSKKSKGHSQIIIVQNQSSIIVQIITRLGHIHTILLVENITAVLESVQNNPSTSIRNLAQEIGLKTTTLYYE